MEIQLVSDPLLKFRMSPLLSFLAPSTHSLWRPTMVSRQVGLLTPKLPKCRNSSFHSTAPNNADSSSTAAELDVLEDKSRPKPTPSPRTASSQRWLKGDILGSQINSILDSTFPSAKKSSESADEPSSTMMETAFRNDLRPRDPTRYHYDIAGKMQYPSKEMTSAGTPISISRDAYRTLEQTQRAPKRATRTVRSRPSVGRTIEVVPEQGVDFGRALRGLDIACAVNRVRQDLSRQRFHERPGMKRKRLKSERWRKMFKESFRATVMRVKEMRRKGW